MAKFLEQGNFPECGARDALEQRERKERSERKEEPTQNANERKYFFVAVEADALEGDNVARLAIMALVHDAVGALTQLRNLRKEENKHDLL
jgi:hypothetical protein